MREPYGKGVATHTDPESCGGGGNIAAEALAGESAGVVLSPEIVSNVSGADRLVFSGRQHNARRYGERRSAPAGSETHSMHRSFLRGNRETLRLATADCAGVRTANSKEIRL